MQLQEFSNRTPGVWGQAPLEEWSDRLQSVCGRFNPLGWEQARRRQWRRRRFPMPPVWKSFRSPPMSTPFAATERDIRLDYGEHFFLLVQLEGTCGVEQQRASKHRSRPETASSSIPRFPRISISKAVSATICRCICPGNCCSPRSRTISRYRGAWLPTIRCRPCCGPWSPRCCRLPPATSGRPNCVSCFCRRRGRPFAADGPDAPLCPKDRAGGRLEFARALVDRHLTDERLTPQWLASRLGVSMRTLQEDFNALGTTVTSFIRDRRLHLARDRLVEKQRGASDGTIAEIAYSSGFNDISYFNRCFKKAFDCSPKELSRG